MNAVHSRTLSQENKKQYFQLQLTHSIKARKNYSPKTDYCDSNSTFSTTVEKLKITTSICFQKKALVAQSCPTLCDPMDCSPPGSSVPGILQARIMEWIAMRFTGDLLTQGLNLDLLKCRQILYRLSHQGSLEWLTSSQ